jgi:hypothetical protein
MISLSSEQQFFLFGIMAFPVVLLGLIGALLGSIFGDWIKDHTSFAISLDVYRILLVTILLVMLVGYAGLVVQTEISRLDRTNNLQNSIQVTNYRFVQWPTGVQNVSADFGPVPRLSGFLNVQWYATAPVSFYVIVLQSTEEARPITGASNGNANIALVSASGPGQVVENFTAWFQIDTCPSTGCASGSVSYSMTIWY